MLHLFLSRLYGRVDGFRAQKHDAAIHRSCVMLSQSWVTLHFSGRFPTRRAGGMSSQLCAGETLERYLMMTFYDFHVFVSHLCLKQISGLQIINGTG